jgi:hypothetical protein
MPSRASARIAAPSALPAAPLAAGARCPGLRLGGKGRGPGADLSCQPGFGLIEKGINFFLVVARPQTGGGELFLPDLIGCQRRFPYSEKRIPDSADEGVNLSYVVTGPQPGGRKCPCPGPLGEHGAINFRIWRRFRALPFHAGVTGRRRRPACRVCRPVLCHIQLIFDRGPGPAPGADLSSRGNLRPAFQTPHVAPPGLAGNRGRGRPDAADRRLIMAAARRSGRGHELPSASRAAAPTRWAIDKPAGRAATWP